MSKTASKVTRCGWRFTSVAAYAARTVSRSCQRTFSSALIASSPSASDTDRPAERSASTKPMWVSRRLTAPASFSSLIARRWSEACLSTTPSVRATVASSRSPIWSAISVRAQSIDSAMDGAFFSSSSRSRTTTSTSWAATLSSRPGTWLVTIARSRSASG